MKAKILVISLLTTCCMTSGAQRTFDSNPESSQRTILTSIEENNKTLRSLRAGNEAMRLENLTGLTLDDPEVNFSYMWGAGKLVADKINIEVNQTFDFATLSGSKKRVAEKQNAMLPQQYRIEAMAILLQAREALVNLTYANALIDLYTTREAEYGAMHQKADTALQRGAMTIMDYNSISMHRYTMQNDLRLAEIDRDSYQRELDMLNGGIHVDYPYVKFCPDTIPASFENWYTNASLANPQLKSLASQLALDEASVDLAKKEGLPSFTVGYTGEIVPEESLHGVAVGISLPLWSNRGKVKAAKAAQTASQIAYEEAVFNFFSEMQTQYERTRALAEFANRCDEIVRLADNKEWLDKSLKAGNMTMIDYVTETDAFTEMRVKALEAWRDYHLALARLLVYE